MQDNPEPTPTIQPEIPQPQPQQPSRMLGHIAGGIVGLILVAGLFVVLQKSKKASVPTQPPVQTLSPKPTLPRSKAPGIITNVVTASSLDAQGKAATLTTAFAKTDKDIYLVLTLDKPKLGTKIEYIRYLNEKYLDKGANKILNPNVSNTSFVWSLKKPGAMHLVGTYKVKVYTNGLFEKETSYTVQ